MTNEELVLMYQQGDKQALDQLIDINKGLVYMIVKRYDVDSTSSLDVEDLEQEGFIGLITAAKRYDHKLEDKAKFSTYAVFWINGKINRLIRQRNTNEEISLNIPIGKDEDVELIETIEGVNYDFENVEEKLYIEGLRKELEEAMSEYNTLQQREILKLRYGWDKTKSMTYEDIGKILNISGPRVRMIEKTALRKLKSSKWGFNKRKELYVDEISPRLNGTFSGVEKKIFYEESLFKKI